ncbi:MAG: 23S rRNA (guanosine(2251)-2'-O)-methyltransferase RlmB [Bacteroidales bacterium]|jgi:23S rRNA (guanosine2251-2'-O)-methyltransferase|nr:23S rRNA (guanosine(2251)-2'-O)-methyltransferase RlmB [Bacteroidales bacterium]MDD2204302.1 23S rRNA (guanosine(2251)-2'-O)-methyltransferase RlmB [Bacteroidales bacterium]MDD3151354.1 23S rRNA (guanosine(2251)-2'-O)-methyltransferase RlmB [Bacteroidales bacterium]MDD3913183.1 23S rRNA (guanosine(2251)-2'-O)-methyltransferase RlmB [Bacteroidales bacterium]MDD4633098.1 23S rRNA (guanosine(2251)-2'-O)-methyltransferase RlmB [Bacteroidales bacterium]
MENTSSKDNIVYGIHPIMEAIEAGKEIEKIFIKKDMRGAQYMELFSMIRQNNINYQFVPLERLNRITRKNHQGIIAYMSAVEYSNLEMIIPTIYERGETPLLLILDGITDVRNFGAICRTAECAGVHAIILPDKGSVLINSDAVKTSAGALQHIPICKVKSLSKTIKYISQCGINIVACTEKAREFYTNISYTKPTAIIMGAEGVGIAPEIFILSQSEAKIPLLGKIESLNVSCATAVILYEVVRQRQSMK